MIKRICIFLLIFVCTTFNTSFAQKSADDETFDKLVYVNIPFWEHFNDDILIENLYTVYKNNHDLKSAANKVDEAKRIMNISFSNELPHLNFNGYAGYIFNSSDELFGSVVIPNYNEAHFLLPLSLNYEVDIWGKNRLKTKARKKSFEMIQQEEKSVYIYITSAFANIYYNLIKADKLIDCQKEIIDLQTEYSELVKKQYQIGTASINDVIASEKSLTYMKEELQNLLEKQDLMQNQLNFILSDRTFSSIDRTDFDDLKVDIKIPQEIDVNLLDSRPDRVSAELQLEKSGIDVKIAKRDFLPSFTIAGNIGFNLYNLSSSHKFLSDIGVVPNWDIFAGGRKIAILKLQKSRYDTAIEEYEKTILKSIQETNDSLFSLKSNHNKSLIAKDRLSYDENELNLIILKEHAGMADKLDILEKKERLLLSKKQQISLKIDEIIGLIQLYQALGGVDFYDTSITL